jgi:hypothetical protein
MSDKPILTADDIRKQIKDTTVYDLLESYDGGFRLEGDDMYAGMSVMIQALAEELEALRIATKKRMWGL